MPGLIAIVGAVGLLYFFVLRDLNPDPKTEPQKPKEKYNPIYFFMMLSLMVLPLVLSFMIFQWNQHVILKSFEAINWHVFVFSWGTATYLIWIICGCLAVAFYVYMIFVKHYYLLILAALVQVGIFVFLWIVWLVFNGTLDIFDSVIIDDTDYRLVQTGMMGSGQLYFLTCENMICRADEVDYLDSFKYQDAELTYDAETHTLIIFTYLNISGSVHRTNQPITIPLID